MSRSFPLMFILALSANAVSVWAADVDFRSECEYQVQAYGIVDAKEYEIAIEDCINSYTHPDTQFIEQEASEIQQDTNQGQ